jgi:rod shape-determining protein MreC
MAILANRIKNNHIDFFKLCASFIKKFLIIILIILSFIIVIYSPQGISSLSLEIVGRTISISLIMYENIFDKINHISKKLHYFNNLEIENVNLKLEVAQLKNKQVEFDNIKHENEALKNIFHVVNNKHDEYITVKLLGVSITAVSKIAILDAGSNHDVQINQIVVNQNGLVGRIIETSSNYSKVLLVNDTNSSIPIKTSSSKEIGILKGNGNYCTMKYVKENHNIEDNEAVITSGSGKIYPKNIIVGFVNKITNDDIIIKPVNFNLATTEFVNILKQVEEMK